MSVAGADNFADAPELPFGESSLPTSSTGLSSETGEPSWYTGTGRKTAWWKFTPSIDCQVNVDLSQSTYSGGDPYAATGYLNVYTGSSLGALTRVTGANENMDWTDPALAQLGEVDFDATGGVTYYVQAEVASWSVPIALVLRVCESTYEWGPYVQPDDYELRSDDSTLTSSFTVMIPSWAKSYTQSFAAADSAHYQEVVDGAAGAATWVDNSGEGVTVPDVGYEVMWDYTSPGDVPYTAHAHGLLSVWQAKPLLFQVGNEPDTTFPYIDTDFPGTTNATLSKWEAEVTFSEWSTAGNGAEEPIAEASATVEVSAPPGMTAPYSSAYDIDFNTVAGPVVGIWTVGGEHNVPVGPARVNITSQVGNDGTNVTALVKAKPSAPSFRLVDAQSFGYIGAEGFVVKAVWTLHPAVRRYLLKHLVVTELVVSDLPALRQLQRGDGLGMSGAPRAIQNRSQQASLRNIGFQ